LSTGAVWAGVVLMSVLSPDLVSGSEHEHLPLAAMTAWLWGLAATGYLALLAMTSDPVAGQSRWRYFFVATAIVWAVATAFSILMPDLVTGSDPTRVPLAALIAPPAACIATGVVCLVTAVQAHWTPDPGSRQMSAAVP
jgi:hypothetical protein